jgi:hypothetical protein
VSKKDHPNNTPGVPMVFPPLLHRLQVKYFNPTIMPLARHAPGFATMTAATKKKEGDGCSFSNFVSNRGALNCNDARCLT